MYVDLALSGDEIPMSSHDLGHIQAVEEALKAAGAEAPLSLVELVYRGTPLSVPPGDDFPYLGYLTPSEVAVAFRKFSALPLTGMAEGPLETITKLGAVLGEAAERKLGLVSVFE